MAWSRRYVIEEEIERVEQLDVEVEGRRQREETSKTWWIAGLQLQLWIMTQMSLWFWLSQYYCNTYQDDNFMKSNRWSFEGICSMCSSMLKLLSVAAVAAPATVLSPSREVSVSWRSSVPSNLRYPTPYFCLHVQSEVARNCGIFIGRSLRGSSSRKSSPHHGAPRAGVPRGCTGRALGRLGPAHKRTCAPQLSLLWGASGVWTARLCYVRHRLPPFVPVARCWSCCGITVYYCTVFVCAFCVLLKTLKLLRWGSQVLF